MAISPKEAIEQVLESQNRIRIERDKLRFNVYQGQLRDEIIAKLRQEFVLPDTVSQMAHRVVPLNITQKIINKLAMVYKEPPLRTPKEDSETDQELIDLYSQSFKVNQRGKWANRYFKLFKHALWEPFIDRDGVPRLRTIPSQHYTPLSDDPVQPERPTVIIKHIKMDAGNPSESRFEYWSDENFLIVDGDGRVKFDEMPEDNQEGINPFGKMPFVYIPENDDGNLVPIPDDDLISMQFVIASILSDLTFASKNQAWSLYVLTGVDQNQTLSLNPTSVVTLPEGASLDTVKPEVDITEMLAEVETLIGMLLTTKNLSVGDISGSIRATNSASGVAMMIDRSETTEDKMDQEAFFIDAEKRLWDLWAHHMLPVFVTQGKLDPEFRGTFSSDFEAQVVFPDMKPFISDKELIEIETAKLSNKLTTKKRVLKSLNKDMDDADIDALIAEIEEEGQPAPAMLQFLRGGANGNVQGSSEPSEGDREGSDEPEGDPEAS